MILGPFVFPLSGKNRLFGRVLSCGYVGLGQKQSTRGAQVLVLGSIHRSMLLTHLFDPQ